MSLPKMMFNECAELASKLEAGDLSPPDFRDNLVLTLSNMKDEGEIKRIGEIILKAWKDKVTL